jgi:hypothetical protein
MRRKGFILLEADIRVGVHLAYMTPKILIWNVRGLNAIEKRLEIRD